MEESWRILSITLGPAHPATQETKQRCDTLRDIPARIEEEKRIEQLQQASGGAVLTRLRGLPGSAAHDLDDKSLTFKLWSTVGAPSLLQTTGVFYYEITVTEIKEDSYPQIGFALHDGMPVMHFYCGDGVGDDDKSWGLDGDRMKLWHAGPVEWPCVWQEGDVIGLAANMETGQIAATKNGVWREEGCGIVFQDERIKTGVYPCLTAGGGFQVKYRFVEHRFPLAQDIWTASGNEE